VRRAAARLTRLPAASAEGLAPEHRAMILIAYDGSPGSDRAIAVAGALVPGGRAHVVHVWGEPCADTRLRPGPVTERLAAPAVG
jgi:hypothetical protein